MSVVIGDRTISPRPIGVKPSHSTVKDVLAFFEGLELFVRKGARFLGFRLVATLGALVPTNVLQTAYKT